MSPAIRMKTVVLAAALAGAVVSTTQDAAAVDKEKLCIAVEFATIDITLTADGANSVAAADLDGDEDLDVVSASTNDNTVAWYANDGAAEPTFTKFVITDKAAGAFAVTTADVDGDEDLDILCASEDDDTVAWYQNNGAAAPSFVKANIANLVDGPASVFAADVDSDHDVDVLAASWIDNTVTWYENSGGLTPFFSRHVLSKEKKGAFSVFAADLDGDGDVDVLAASRADNTVTWWENVGADYFGPIFDEHIVTTTALGCEAVSAADLDGDEDLDILSASSNDHTVAWYLNDQTAATPETRFAQKTVITSTALRTGSVAAADIDGDDDLDVTSASYADDTIAWYENDGMASPSFTTHIISTAADGAKSVCAADLDGDQDFDLVSASKFDDKVAWYENNCVLAPTAFPTAQPTHKPRTKSSSTRTLPIVAVAAGVAAFLVVSVAGLMLLWKKRRPFLALQYVQFMAPEYYETPGDVEMRWTAPSGAEATNPVYAKTESSDF